MKNEIKIGNIAYPLINSDNSYRNSLLYVDKDENNNIISISLECYFDTAKKDSEDIEPSLIINTIDMKPTNTLKGFNFEVKTAEEADDREDTFYYYEHEPFENYKLIINDYDDKKANISIVGNAIIDGYKDPYENKKIELNCELPVKITKKPQLKFNAKSNKIPLRFLATKSKFVFYDNRLEIYRKSKLIKTIKYEEINEIKIKKNVKNTVLINYTNDKLNIYKVSDEICTKIKNIINK